MLQKDVRDCKHVTGEVQDYGHATTGGQRLWAFHKRLAGIMGMLQEMVIDRGHAIRDGKMLWSN